MWTRTTEDRLLLWREQREQISTLNKAEAIAEATKYWCQAPIASQYLSADLIKDWPDPWELLQDNCYDDISITLMTVFTLVFARTDCDEFKIKMLVDESGEEFHTAWFADGKYIINYEYGDVVSSDKLPSNMRLKYEYNFTDLKINNYK